MMYWAVVPAAGEGRRLGGPVPKQYLRLGTDTVIEHTVLRLSRHPRIAQVVVVLAESDPRWPEVATRLANRLPRPPWTAAGGAERCHSVLSGLERLADEAAEDDWVLVHDAARPCLGFEDLDRLIETLGEHPVGGLLALPVGDTLKRGDEGDAVLETVDRAALWRALTPQMFRFGALRAALSRCVEDGIPVTDESQAIERYPSAAGRPRLVLGSPTNIKITHPADLELARRFLDL